MKETNSDIVHQLARLASRFQEQRTGHAPKEANVVLDDDLLIVTLRDALTPAEKALARSPKGAAQVQDFHRQLFADSTDEMWREIKRITGRQVREASAEIETATGAVAHAFTSGAMVQVFLLDQETGPGIETDRDSIDRANDDGLRVVPAEIVQGDESAPRHNPKDVRHG